MRPAINILADELAAAAAFCRAESCGAEITAFADPSTLDAPTCQSVAVTHRHALEGLAAVSSHGPFLDLYVTSGDPRIVEVCRARHEQALRASWIASARIYVAHLNSIPLIRNTNYLELFSERSAGFWRPLAELAWENGMTIALENMWEETPDLQKRVVNEVGHPGLKASFDNGHALVFSDLPARTWIETLGPDLVHCHLHDNDGAYDSHLPLGDGIEDWPSLLQAIGTLERRPMVVLESDTLDRNRTSLAAWRRMTAQSSRAS